MTEQTPNNVHADEQARAVAWELDRHTETLPLPGADQSHYSSEAQRQAALEVAEKKNIARAAGELGLTSGEWHAKRTELGRSPNAGDIRK